MEYLDGDDEMAGILKLHKQVQGVRGNIGWNSTKIKELKEGYKEV